MKQRDKEGKQQEIQEDQMIVLSFSGTTVNFSLKDAWGQRTHQASYGCGKSVDLLHQARFNGAQQPDRNHRGKKTSQDEFKSNQCFQTSDDYFIYGNTKFKPSSSKVKQLQERRQKSVKLCEGEQKPDKNIFEGPAVASGSFMTRQILNQSWESVVLLPPAGSC